MKRVLGMLMAMVMMLGSMAGALAEDSRVEEIPLPVNANDSEKAFYTYTEASGEKFDLFEIVKWQEDENHHISSVTGRFERIAMGEESEIGEYADKGKSFVTFPLAKGFYAMMVQDTTEPEMQKVSVTDLHQWYIHAYMNDEAPENGEIIFQYDFPQEEREEATFDFWFITVRIVLNDAGEIVYMEYVYVPWE